MTKEVRIQQYNLIQMEDKSQRRNLQQLYKPPPPQDYSSNYVRLGLVIAIAAVFIGVEVVGGTIAKSIAIISDAIHLVSDLLGFVFSFVFLYLSKKEMDERVSFGYHRMELIGALVNIFIVWAMVIFIMIEATQRIVNKEFVERPAIMLITAIAGMLINVILYKILHGGASHSHGLMSGHDHDHDHSHDSSQSSDQCSNQCRDEACNKTVNEAHCHKGNDRNVHRHFSTKKDQEPIKSLEEKLNPVEQCSIEHVHTNTCYLKKPASSQVPAHKHVCDGHHQHHEGHAHKHEGHQHDDHNHEGHKHDSKEHKHEGHNHAGHKHDAHDHQEHEHEGHHHDHDHGEEHAGHESIGMKSSVLHALSDLVQSVGVVISALIIYFWGSDQGNEVKEWNAVHLFDPIATYLFSILSLAATYPVIKNCYYLIMESTPENLSLDTLREEFEAIEGVIDVHDIHVWDLKPGKTIIIAHVLSKMGMERAILTSLTDLCRHKRIYHSTFQVEEQDQKDAEDYILCHHDIH